MSNLRPNRKSGMGKYVNLGFLGKYKTYKNTEFKELPTLSKEEEQQLLVDALKPYSYTPSKHRAIRAAGAVGGAPAPSPTPSATVTPTITPTLTPTPTPSPFIGTASIQPTSAETYNDVTLTGSTNLSSPTYIWTLTDFRDTSGNTITSYTGNPLTTGYFISSGSTNVRLDVVGVEGSAFTTNFSISEWTPDSISGLTYWIDPSNESSVSTRTSGSDVFVESIDNLASTSSTYSGVSNSVAVEQPYYVTSTGMTNGLKTIMNTGFRSTYTTSLKDLGNVVTGDTFTFLRVGYHGVSSNYYAFQKIGITSTSNRIYLEETGPTSPTNDDLRIRYRESGSFRTTWKSNFWNGLYSNSGLTYGFIWENNGVDPWQFEAYIDGAQWTGWTSENTVAPTANFPIGYSTNFMDHVLNASAGGQTWDGYEELGEWVCYDRVLSQSEIDEINQYLTRKWGV